MWIWLFFVLHFIVTDQYHTQMSIRCLFKKDMVPLSSQVSMKIKPTFLPTKKKKRHRFWIYLHTHKNHRLWYCLSFATLLCGFGFYQFDHYLSTGASLYIPLFSIHLVFKICKITVFTNLWKFSNYLIKYFSDLNSLSFSSEALIRCHLVHLNCALQFSEALLISTFSSVL